MTKKNQVVLVDENDLELGTMEKLEAHKKGLLHRAFSVFIFNRKGEMLLQKRAAKKYHSPNLWSNACCSHPMPGEDTLAAAHRRLQEELGFDTELNPLFQFVYKTDFDNGLTEHEFDHVFIGYYDGEINPDDAEISDYCFIKTEAISESLERHHHKYTSWFKIAFSKLESQLVEKNY
jgi:isopentenyl-diphosphate delta-isomerase